MISLVIGSLSSIVDPQHRDIFEESGKFTIYSEAGNTVVLTTDPTAFAVVGMAAFFTGVVQAPITGIVLVTEMTGAFTTLLPMLAACFAAMVVANLLRTAPIYDSLRESVTTPGRWSS